MTKLRNILGLLCFLLALACASLRAQEIERPTSETNTSVAANYCTLSTWYSGTLPNFWDGSGVSTSTSQTASSLSTLNRFKSSRLSGFSTSSTYSALSLNVNYSCTIPSGVASCNIYYSVNGGGAYTLLERKTATAAQHTATVSLDPGQDLSQVIVQWEACSAWNVGAGTSYNATIVGFDVWTEGTVTSSSKKPRFQVVSD